MFQSMFLLLSLFRSVITWSPNCDPCQCSEVQQIHIMRVADCSSAAVTDFPQNLPDSLDIVDMTNNVLTSVSSSDLESLPYLRTLQGIEALEYSENAFSHLQELQKLSIVIHQEEIPQDLFKDLKLHHLYMEAKSAVTFPSTLFKSGSINLVNLTIIAPELNSLDENILFGLTQLKHLRIEAPTLQSLPQLFHQSDSYLSPLMPSNMIEICIKGVESVPQRLLWNQLSLERVELHSIENLPSGLFENSPTINYLDLSSSSVNEISAHWFSALRSLRYLSLRNTSLQFITEEKFRGLDSLTILDVSSNNLNVIPDETFQNFKNTLMTLNLSNNQITLLQNLTFRAMFSLETLDVSNNQLVNLSPWAFSDLQKLSDLYLQSNNLTFIPDYILQHQRNLQTLTVASNKLAALPSTLLAKASNLLYVDFSDNSIVTFPISFFSNIRFLQTLMIKDNPLHCDCQLKELKYGFRSQVIITGTCLTPEYLNGSDVMDAIEQVTCSDEDSSLLVSTVYESTMSVDGFTGTFLSHSNNLNSGGLTHLSTEPASYTQQHDHVSDTKGSEFYLQTSSDGTRMGDYYGGISVSFSSSATSPVSSLPLNMDVLADINMSLSSAVPSNIHPTETSAIEVLYGTQTFSVLNSFRDHSEAQLHLSTALTAVDSFQMPLESISQSPLRAIQSEADETFLSFAGDIRDIISPSYTISSNSLVVTPEPTQQSISLSQRYPNFDSIFTTSVSGDILDDVSPIYTISSTVVMTPTKQKTFMFSLDEVDSENTELTLHPISTYHYHISNSIFTTFPVPPSTNTLAPFSNRMIVTTPTLQTTYESQAQATVYKLIVSDSERSPSSNRLVTTASIHQATDTLAFESSEILASSRETLLGHTVFSLHSFTASTQEMSSLEVSESTSIQEVTVTPSVIPDVNVTVKRTPGKGRGDDVTFWSGMNTFYVVGGVACVCSIVGMVMIKRWRDYVIRRRRYEVEQSYIRRARDQSENDSSVFS